MVWLFGAGSAWARETAIQLQWQGPENCRDDGSVAREIRRILGDSPVLAEGQSVFVIATVTTTSDSRWLVNLRTRSGDLRGERSLVASSCTEVRRATALIVALMIDPDMQLTASEPRESEPTPLKPPSAQATPEPSPPAKTVAPVPDRKTNPPARLTGPGQRTITPLIGLDALAALGTLPGGGTGVGVALGVGLERASFHLSGAAWLPRKKVSDEQLEAGGRFSLWSANLLFCYDLTSSAAEFGPCLGGGGRRMRGEGFGVTDPGSANSTWAALVAQWYASIPLTTKVAFRLAVGTEFPFRAPTFNLAGLGRVHSPSSVAAGCNLGLWLKF